jgi:hypothetical protein
MGILFIIFFIAIISLFLLPSIILSLISTVISWFGFLRRKPGNAKSHGDERVRYTRSSGNGAKEGKGKQGKLFDKDEGEYVDFEEIK